MGHMKTSSNGVAFVARWESEVLHTYIDRSGNPTIGFGHKLLPGEWYPNGITHDAALSLLAGDLRNAEAQVNAQVKPGLAAIRADNVSLTQNAFDALVSFTFNCGGGALRQSTVLHDIGRGDYFGAAKAFLLWDKDEQGGVLTVDSGLLSRRNSEMELFLKPDGAP